MKDACVVVAFFLLLSGCATEHKQDDKDPPNLKRAPHASEHPRLHHPGQYYSEHHHANYGRSLGHVEAALRNHKL